MNRLIKKLFFFIIFLLFFLNSVWTQGLPTARPEEVGLSSERLSRIDKLMEDYVAHKKVSGVVVLVARHGKVAYLKSIGMMDIEAGKPMQNDTVFRIASMTKPITATAIMMLYEEGRFLLNDRVSKYIPEFKNFKVLIKPPKDAGEQPETVPAKREITIHHLLTHTSGIGYSFFNSKLRPIYRKAGVPDGAIAIDSTIGEKMKILAGLPLNNHPGEALEYGLSVDVLGYLVEVISGMTLDEFFQERIFKPLKMKDTHFFLPEKKHDRLAELYEPTKNGDLKKYPDGVVERGSFRFSASFPKDEQRTYFSGGSGLTSTISDYVRYAQMLLNGGELDGVRLLSRKTIELMTINQIGDLSYPGSAMGLNLSVLIDLAKPGFLLGKSDAVGSVGKFGMGGIFYTCWWADPKEELIGIMMSQIYPWGHLDLSAKFEVLAYQAIVD